MPSPTIACDPDNLVNFHEEPIIPKEEPVDLNEIPIPRFLQEKEEVKKKKSRVVKPRPQFINHVPKVVKPIENKDDYLYIADIQEESSINLYLDELTEVRGIGATHKLPERLVFVYKGGKEMTWPLHRILNEPYSTLIKVFTCIKKRHGFKVQARSELVTKISQLRQSWNNPDSLPKKLKIPYTGRVIHLQPYWMMEFRDRDNCRRFFRIEDQLGKASNETLLFLQSKLNTEDEEEAMFYRRLQAQIEENNARKGKKTRPQRKRN